nr:pheromone [Rhizopogon roseolus]
MYLVCRYVPFAFVSLEMLCASNILHLQARCLIDELSMFASGCMACFITGCEF